MVAGGGQMSGQEAVGGFTGETAADERIAESGEGFVAGFRHAGKADLHVVKAALCRDFDAVMLVMTEADAKFHIHFLLDQNE